MEDEEDDLYGSAAPEGEADAPHGNAPIKAEQMDVSEDSDEDSDDVRDLHREYIAQEINSNPSDRIGHSNHN